MASPLKKPKFMHTMPTNSTNANTSTSKELQQILIDLAHPANIARIKMIDQKTALDIAGFAGIPTQDARGNILQSIWSKHYDNSSIGLLLERNDVRVLLLKQLEQQIKEQKESINMLEQSDVLCKWILDFTQSWENQYNASKLQNFDIGQVVLSAMQETFFVIEQYLEEFCELKPSLIRKRIKQVMKQAKHVKAVKTNVQFSTDEYEDFHDDVLASDPTTNPNNSTDTQPTDLHFFGEESAMIRYLFRNDEFGMQTRRVAGKVLKKQEVCNKPGAYSARIQRNDITQEVDWALDHFCKMMDYDVMRECMHKIQTDDRYILQYCIDHRGFPRNKDAHSVSM